MTYVGSSTQRPDFTALDFGRAYAVVVRTQKVGVENPNICGHVLLYIGGGMGHYFHLPGIGVPDGGNRQSSLYQHPHYFPASEYEKYLTLDEKVEIGRYRMGIPRQEEARKQLEVACTEKRVYLLLPQNCVTFVEEILRAGGNYYNLNQCPTLAAAGIELSVRINGKTHCGYSRTIGEIPRFSARDTVPIKYQTLHCE